MPTITDKNGNKRFSMNPQVGKAMFGGSAPGMDLIKGGSAASPDQQDDVQDQGADDHVELHHGGNPEGDPPPHEGTKYHTIATKTDGSAPEIKNHDDYPSADQHMQQCMGESTDNGDSMEAIDTGDGADGQ